MISTIPKVCAMEDYGRQRVNGELCDKFATGEDVGYLLYAYLAGQAQVTNLDVFICKLLSRDNPKKNIRTGRRALNVLLRHGLMGEEEIKGLTISVFVKLKMGGRNTWRIIDWARREVWGA